MTRAWTLRAAPVAMLLVAACQDAPTSPIAAPEEAGGGLTFLMPDIDRSMLVEASIETGDSLTAGPARVSREPGAPPPPPPAGPSESRIWDARTTGGFNTGSAWSRGSHRYQGNVGTVSTTVTVSLEGATIGSQSAMRRQDIAFWADFALPHYISTLARAFVSQDCGLMTRGDSMHEAWWEVSPPGILDFNKSIQTSFTPVPEFQPECAPPSPPPTDGGGGGGGGGQCWVNIWYDEETGEIWDMDVLYCEPFGG